MPESPVRLAMSGDVDIATEDFWRERADALLAAHPHTPDVVVDMAEVTFLDSRGMAVLVHLHAAALERGGKLSLQSLSPRVSKALTVAGLNQVFQLDSA